MLSPFDVLPSHLYLSILVDDEMPPSEKCTIASAGKICRIVRSIFEEKTLFRILKIISESCQSIYLFGSIYIKDGGEQETCPLLTTRCNNIPQKLMSRQDSDLSFESMTTCVLFYCNEKKL